VTEYHTPNPPPPWDRPVGPLPPSRIAAEPTVDPPELSVPEFLRYADQKDLL
jgi:hypothetical protein